MRAPGERDQLTTALGRVIAATRKEAGLTQEELAYRSGMHPTSISHIERGINSPTVRVLGVIARHLSIPASVLVSKAEQEVAS